ncbi:MAG: phage portal protein [Oligosphaeraceae bacterium]
MLRLMRNQYEALRHDSRRPPLDIRTDATLTQQEFRGDQRIRAYELGNLAYENDSIGAIVDTCVRLTVGPRGGRPFFTGKDASQWQTLWNEWARHAGFAEGENWSDLLSMILRTVKIHGDCLVLLDPELTNGKLRIWDADQICPLGEDAFRQWGESVGVPVSGAPGEPVWTQAEGVVLDAEGRVQGYFVTSARNRYAVSLDQASFLPASLCRRVSEHPRISQFRGVPVILPTADLTNDTRSLIKAEVAAAKNYSATSLILEQPDIHAAQAAVLSAVTDEATGAIDPAVLEAASISDADVKSQLSSLLDTTSPNLQAIEGKSAIGYVPTGTQVHELSNANRPSQPIQQWMDKLADINGQRLGVQSCLARGRADNSYSSGQIELEISWSKFQEDQKMLERQVVDYAVSILCPGADYTVVWPRAFEIDPQKAEATYDAQLRGGRNSFQRMMGPGWESWLDDRAEFKAACEARGLDPNLFSWYGQTVAGATLPTEDSSSDSSQENV